MIRLNETVFPSAREGEREREREREKHTHTHTLTANRDPEANRVFPNQLTQVRKGIDSRSSDHTLPLHTESDVYNDDRATLQLARALKRGSYTY